MEFAIARMSCVHDEVAAKSSSVERSAGARLAVRPDAYTDEDGCVVRPSLKGAGT